jgi:DNA polymerase I-like protein with 3'-5' exonuclease and polymerase domains/uracil-DNA glycosylase
VSRAALSQEVKLNLAKSMGLAAVEDMNPDAKSPNLQPSLVENPDIYVILDRPEIIADETGDASRGAGPDVLRSITHRHGIRACIDYCVRTLTPKDREPEAFEIEAFRPEIEKSIDESGATVVVLAGTVAIRWGMGKSSPKGNLIEAARGRFWPGIVNGREVTFMAAASPKWISIDLAEANAKKRSKKSPLPWGVVERTKSLGRDFKRATMLARRHAQAAPRRPLRSQELMDEVEVLEDPESILAALGTLREERPARLAFDLETTALRPYGSGSRISTFAVSVEGRTLSFPWMHAEVGFSSKDRHEIGQEIKALLTECPLVIAHNAVFECEWTGEHFGLDWLQSIHIDCTMNRAYILDERRGGLSLDLTFFEASGIGLKALSPDVDVRFVEVSPLKPLLRYGGLDTAATLRLWHSQERRIRQRDLQDAAELQRRRILPAAICQLQGFHIDQTGVRRQKFEAEGSLEIIHLEVSKHPLAIAYAQNNGAFNPGSDAQLVHILESLGREEYKVEQRDGSIKNSVDREVLKQIVAAGGQGASLCQQILEYRDIAKRLSTFVSPYDASTRDSLIYPDGKVHGQMNIAFTSTGRWSSNGPNLQNLPARSEEGKKVRQLFTPPPGHVVVASDYASLEARVIAMCSQDEVWSRMVREGYDAHGEWAEIAARQSPSAFRTKIDADDWDSATKAQRKEYRAIIKNALVFPAFFGSGAFSIARNLNMDQKDCDVIFEKFWDTFAGVKAWQENLIHQYKEQGYTSCLTGRRRYGPLQTLSMVLNSPVQGTAADLMSESLANLCDLAKETARPYLRPYLTVHDEAVFCVPEEHLEEAVMDISKAMGKPWGEWANVPLQIETEVGPSFGDLELYSIVDCPAYGDAPVHTKVYWKPDDKS